MQPAPQRTAADGRHQAALLDLLNRILSAPTRYRQAVLRRQLAGKGLNLYDELWGKKSGGDLDDPVLPTRRDGR
jgi:hypothetical protein